MRQIPNARKNPRRRPQRKQRRMMRVENFGFFCARATTDFFAIVDSIYERTSGIPNSRYKAIAPARRRTFGTTVT